MAYTLEQKIDICLRFVASNNMRNIAELRRRALEALKSDNIPSVAPEQETDDDRINDLITGLLKDIGMPPHLIGYDCTLHALRLILSDHEYLNGINKCLYPDVAKCIRPDYTASRVERAIRHAVEVVFDRGDVDYIQELFGNTINANRGKLANLEFLAFCERELRRRMKKVCR